MDQSVNMDARPLNYVFARKCVVLIIDGSGDLPVAALGGNTPLEAAHTPILDKLAAAGNYGLVDPIKPGVIPDTHSGTGLLMGLLPEQLTHLHRGPVEAAGAGLVLSTGDIAMRTNFATIERRNGSLIVTDRRAGRILDGTHTLAEKLKNVDLGDGIRATLCPTDQHRGVLVLSGEGLDAAISNTDPGNCTLPVELRQCTALKPEAELTASKVNLFIAEANRQLENHPLNRSRISEGKLPATGIITRGAGQQLLLDNVLRDFDLKGAVVSGCNTVLGVGRMFGFDAFTDPAFTTALDTDLEAKVRSTLAALQDHDVVYLHVKAADNCSHDLQPLAKRDFLERIDNALQPLVDADLILAVAADHSTDSNSGFHTADPVPSLVCDTRSIHQRERVSFGETSCLQGNMDRQTGHEFLQHVLQAMHFEIA